MEYMEWNYIQAKRQADKLSEQADRLDKLASNQMAGTLGAVCDNWKGDNAAAYIRKGSRMKNEISSLASDLRRAASVIRSSAERIYRAELLAKELARGRNY